MKLNRHLHFFTIIITGCTFVLICSGGLVTSKGVGMSVPDWPTTYGYNMFLFPISRWIDGVWYEHTHRLSASIVGLLTFLLVVWILAVEKRRWVRIIGILTLISVIVQGILGGLRVTLNTNAMGILHGIIAQSFLSLLGILVIVTSSTFLSGEYTNFHVTRGLQLIVTVVTGMIFIQLMIAASMRHAHAGLAIPDFPTFYGKWWPPLDMTSITQINKMRAICGQVDTTIAQIVLQTTHRVFAVLIFAGVIIFTWLSRHVYPLNQWGIFWILLIITQMWLGTWTIWSNKAADVTTAHTSVGALAFFLGIQLTFRLFLCRQS